ncbi:hypothetical protein [Legionella maceachernii]|uniref:Uncharacterized protein n=1 Tax=Legionella maceachernii TaxID=466 RepID=A0A0W0VVI2_9GAMM|nr:hypothetical protein [Legionella maceachernii]KTD23933.1 hypothetical protein Lmac_2806 [Legionella maceachernii]SKA18465.1 hypothetical protein SAMN02745128_02432 [Legionella maceachernii]SUP04508.1 Uncharacterised protein [Legionella maceachernii]
MSNADLSQQFAISFAHAADGLTVTMFANSIRFLALMLMIVAILFSINQFMADLKAQEDFLTQFAFRLIRLIIACCCFLLLLTTKG